MKTFEEFLDCELEEFESPEYQAEFNELSEIRRNNILFKRLLFDYDEDLKVGLRKFIRNGGKDPVWSELTTAYPELKYILTDPQNPLQIAKETLKEITL
jgi:hypothetical protein